MKIKVILISGILLLLLLGGVCVFVSYQKFLKNAVHPDAPKYLYVPTGSSYANLLLLIEKEHVLKDMKPFKQLAEYKKLSQAFHSGKYKIDKGMSVNSLINKLRSGNQEEVKLVFNNIRTKEQLAQRVSNQLELDGYDLLELLDDSNFLKKYGFNSNNILCMFIPNTYSFWWNTSDTGFVERMYKEYRKFWSEKRLSEANEIGLTPAEVAVLASIVEEENHRKDEQARIAGLYMNRLKKGMLLQSDPTVRFALGDFSIKRFLLKDLEIESPYNTYKYAGLPPGPIRIPEAHVVDAVLHYEKHNYLYMCAKEDFSGYHNFAVTSQQHALNAVKYHRVLNRQRIMR
mgnify:CR=1 FL=1